MGVAHPLIRPSTPFDQTSTHRSRKPAPFSPALSVSFARSLSLFLCLSFFLPSSVLSLVLSSPSFDHPRPDPPSSLQARTDTSNAPALSHRLSDTHARHRYRWDASTYYTHTHTHTFIDTRTHVRVCVRANALVHARLQARVYVCIYASRCEYIRSFVRGVGKNVIPSAPAVVPRQPTSPAIPRTRFPSPPPCALHRARQDHEFVSAKLFESTSRIIEVRAVKRQPFSTEGARREVGRE